MRTITLPAVGLLTIVSLAGCSKPSVESRLLGTWNVVGYLPTEDAEAFAKKTAADAGGLSQDEINRLKQSISAPFPMAYGTLAFQKDGTYTLQINPLTNKNGAQTVEGRTVAGRWQVVTQLEGMGVIRLVPGGDDPSAKEREVGITFLSDDEVDFPFEPTAKNSGLKIRFKLVRQKG